MVNPRERKFARGGRFFELNRVLTLPEPELP